MHGHASTFSEQVLASIIITDDSGCGMSDVAFRTVPPIGGLSCLLKLIVLPFPVANDTISPRRTERPTLVNILPIRKDAIPLR